MKFRFFSKKKFYKNKEYKDAINAFFTQLEISPAGVTSDGVVQSLELLNNMTHRGV